MSKVQLRVPPGIAGRLKTEGSDWFTLEQEVGEGATIGTLLADVASRHTDFRKAIFNPDIGKVNDQIMVFLNENLLPESDIIDAKLNDGDTVILLPVYTGG